MKPKTAPASLDWTQCPTFDDLKEQSRCKVAALRLLLVDVPCWRCEDNSVRYDLELSEAAIADTPGVLEEQNAENASGDLTVLGMLDKQMQINASTAKQHNETLKAMGEPLRAGVELWGKAWDRQEKRLIALEATNDRMLAVLELGLSSQHERDLATKKHEAAAQLRGQTFAVVKEQLPKIVNKWGLTSKANTAIEFIASLDPKMVDALMDLEILNAKQLEQLRQLRPIDVSATPAPEPQNGMS